MTSTVASTEASAPTSPESTEPASGSAMGRAHSCLAVSDGARGPIRKRRVRAGSRGGCAHACLVALILRRTCHRVGTRAGTCHAGIGLRARVLIAAWLPIGLSRIVACARHRIARSRHVARVDGRTHHGRAPAASARAACLSEGTGIGVVARQAVGTSRRARIADHSFDRARHQHRGGARHALVVFPQLPDGVSPGSKLAEERIGLRDVAPAGSVDAVPLISSRRNSTYSLLVLW